MALIGAAQITCADTFVLYSGEIIKGVILSETASKITIEVPNEKGTVSHTNTLSKFAIQSIVRETLTKTPQSDISPDQNEQQIHALIAQGNFEKAIKTLEVANSFPQTAASTNTARLLQLTYRQFLDSLTRKQKQISNTASLANDECVRVRQSRDSAQTELEEYRRRRKDLAQAEIEDYNRRRSNYYYNGTIVESRPTVSSDTGGVSNQAEEYRLKGNVAHAAAKVIKCEDQLADLQKQLAFVVNKIADIQSKLDQN